MYVVWHIKDLLSNMELGENDTYDKSNLDTLPLSEKKYTPTTIFPKDRTPIPLKKKILQFNLSTSSKYNGTVPVID